MNATYRTVPTVHIGSRLMQLRLRSRASLAGGCGGVPETPSSRHHRREDCRRDHGSEAIAAFTSIVFADYLGVDSIVVTPQAANIPSCRVLEKAAYERMWVGMLDSDDPSDAGRAALCVRQR